jgi:hypothetical protein
VLGGGVGILALLAMAYAGFGGFGRRRFAQGSLITEAHFNVALLARGIAACAEGSDTHISQKRALPESTAFVPAATDALRNGYVSTAKDWESHAFHCAKFALREPQQFQYRWETTGPGRGRAEAQGDLNGDGQADVFLHVSVTCADAAGAFRCEIGSVEPSPWAPVLDGNISSDTNTGFVPSN